MSADVGRGRLAVHMELLDGLLELPAGCHVVAVQPPRSGSDVFEIVIEGPGLPAPQPGRIAELRYTATKTAAKLEVC